MKIEWEDRVYDTDFLGALMSQAAAMTAYTGCKTMAEWEQLLTAKDDERFPRAVTAACWLMLRQDGQDADLATMDIPFIKFFLALGAAAAGEAAAAAEDPTKPAAGSGGTSPEPAAASAG